MKYTILLKILFLLLSRKKVSARYIADRYEISVRTVYRYIDELSLAGVPIYNERGRYGGYAIADNYKLPANFLTEEESEKVISSLSGLNSELHSNVLEVAIEKIASISKVSETSSAINFGNLIIDGSAWGSSDGYGQTLQILQKAIENNSLVLITYVDRDGQSSERTIEPHVLALKQGLWYAYSYCRLRNRFRLFKLGRIQKLKVLDSPFTRRDITDMKEVFLKWYDEPEEDVDLLVNKSVKADVEEWLGVDKISISPSGKIHATAKLPVDDYLTAKILSFGDKVTVLSPKSLKDAVIKKAKAVENLYK
ncbi:MAG: YafY family transcriptional regulator [Clostridia bacterium]|nr:YafY family transcriptional regulator [Clostridia bacterium]